MKVSTRRAGRNAILLAFIFSAIVLLLCLQQFQKLPKLYSVIIWITVPILLLTGVAICVFVYRNKGIGQSIQTLRLLNSLEESLISIGAYKDFSDSKVILPKIKVDTAEKQISISINDLKTRSRIETNKEILSSALPNGLTVYTTYISKDENSLLIKYKDISKDKREILENAYDFAEWVDKDKFTTIRLDRNNYVDLTENNGILITGKSGSGKSFFAQMLLAQGIMKHWDISILDYKRSYQAFRDYCDVAFSVDEIISSLDAIILDLHNRQQAMDEILKQNPQALAIDNGFPVKFVLIEEYLALVNSGTDKKTLERIEKMILEITTTGRSLNVYLCMVLQVSSSQALNTSIRANLPIKIVFGNPERTIYETTFGKGSVPDIVARMEKGEGLCSIDGDIIPFSAPFAKFNIREILLLLK